MLNNNLSLVIGKFSKAWSSANWVGLSDPATSPRGPLDFFTQSPSPKQYHLGGVGLGLVVEMEKSGEKTSASKAVFGQIVIRPNTILNHEETGVDDLGDHGFVTSHVTIKSCTRVYGDDSNRKLVGEKNYRVCFYISSPIIEDVTQYSYEFLNSCHLCKKQLHGKDIYMYRGEKGFCSNECRYEQIISDQHDKKQ